MVIVLQCLFESLEVGQHVHKIITRNYYTWYHELSQGTVTSHRLLIPPRELSATTIYPHLHYHDPTLWYSLSVTSLQLYVTAHL
jgi:hypothetical protein